MMISQSWVVKQCKRGGSWVVKRPVYRETTYSRLSTNFKAFPYSMRIIINTLSIISKYVVTYDLQSLQLRYINYIVT